MIEVQRGEVSGVDWNTNEIETQFRLILDNAELFLKSESYKRQLVSLWMSVPATKFNEREKEGSGGRTGIIKLSSSCRCQRSSPDRRVAFVPPTFDISLIIKVTFSSKWRENENRLLFLVGRWKPINRFHYALHGGQVSDETVDSVDVSPRLTRIELTDWNITCVGRTRFQPYFTNDRLAINIVWPIWIMRFAFGEWFIWSNKYETYIRK